MGRDALRARCVLCGTAAQRRAGPAQQRVCEDGNALEGQAAQAQETGGPTVREIVRFCCRESRSLPLYSYALQLLNVRRTAEQTTPCPDRTRFAPVCASSGRRPHAGTDRRRRPPRRRRDTGRSAFDKLDEVALWADHEDDSAAKRRLPRDQASPSGRKRWLRKRMIVASRSSTS